MMARLQTQFVTSPLETVESHELTEVIKPAGTGKGSTRADRPPAASVIAFALHVVSQFSQTPALSITDLAVAEGMPATFVRGSQCSASLILVVLPLLARGVPDIPPPSRVDRLEFERIGFGF